MYIIYPLNNTIEEKDRLIGEAKQCEARLKRAGILTGGLADEGVRWEATVEQIADDILNLTGDVFLSSASISYYEITYFFWKDVLRNIGTYPKLWANNFYC